jgi:hypothetical protein
LESNNQAPITKSQINSKAQYPKVGLTSSLGHWSLVIGDYLAFEICLLGFLGAGQKWI